MSPTPSGVSTDPSCDAPVLRNLPNNVVPLPTSPTGQRSNNKGTSPAGRLAGGQDAPTGNSNSGLASRTASRLSRVPSSPATPPVRAEMDKGFLDSSTTPCGVTVNFPWRLAAAKAAAVKSVGASHFENDSTTATPPSVSASRQRSTTPAGNGETAGGDELGNTQDCAALTSMRNLARKVVRDGARYMPKCRSSTELLAQTESLLKVGELGVCVGLTGPDGPAGAASIMSKTLLLPGDVDVVQSDMPFELPPNSDVVVILVDASQPNWLLGLPNQGSPRRKEGSIGGRCLLSCITEGPVDALARRAIRHVGTHNVFLGVSGCGAEAAGTAEDRARTEATVAEAAGLQAEQVACFGLPGGALFGGGLGGGTVGGRKRLLSWCCSIQDSATSIQEQRANQIRGLLDQAARVVAFWAELRGPRSTTSWIVTRILGAAVQGIPRLGMLGAEELAASSVGCAHGEVTREAVDQLVKSQAGLSFTTSFLSGLGGIFTAPVSMPMSLAASILVRLRLCLALAALGGYKAVEPNVVASALSCVTQCRRGVELAKLVLQPELPSTGVRLMGLDVQELRLAEEGSSEEDSPTGGGWAAQKAVAAAVCSAESVRRQALLEGASPAEAERGAQQEFAARLPMAIAARTGALILETSGGSLLGHAADTVPLLGGMVSGGVDGAVLAQAARAAVEAFLPHVSMSFDASDDELRRDSTSGNSSSSLSAEEGCSHGVLFEELKLDESGSEGEESDDEQAVLVRTVGEVGSEDNSPRRTSPSSWGSVAKMANTWVPQLWTSACPQPSPL